MSELTRRSRIEGGIYGLLVGDALGVPYEFHAPESVPPIEELEFEPPARFERSHPGVPVGTWSDDGAHALCLLASLLEQERLDVRDLSARLLRWYEEGYLAVDGIVFDVGVQTSAAIRQFAAGVPPLECGAADEQANGNGSLMRVLPLALWHRGSDGELVADARLQSCVTHGHVRAQVCCALYCLWARYTLFGREDAWCHASGVLRDILAHDEEALGELEWSVRPDEPLRGTGSGYVVDCLRSARVAVSEPSFELAVKRAVSLGRDTDTTAAVAGGIAGVRDGVGAIPHRWLDALRDRDVASPLVDALVSLAATVPSGS